jgi:hypothetical protein
MKQPDGLILISGLDTLFTRLPGKDQGSAVLLRFSCFPLPSAAVIRNFLITESGSINAALLYAAAMNFSQRLSKSSGAGRCLFDLGMTIRVLCSP